MKKSRELRALARAQLKGNWLIAVLMIIVFCAVVGVSGFVIVGPWIIGGPLYLGLMIFYLNLARKKKAKFENLFDGFKCFATSMILYILQMLFIFLWSLLLFIPGIIKSFSYSMAFFILRDNPKIGAKEAITQSRKMMNGYKFRLFCLCLSFTGWFFLSLLTFGIGFLWLIPYMFTSIANFYENIKSRKR